MEKYKKVPTEVMTCNGCMFHDRSPTECPGAKPGAMLECTIGGDFILQPDASVTILYFVAVKNGFLAEGKSVIHDIRRAKPFESFMQADEAGRASDYPYWSILNNMQG